MKKPVPEPAPDAPDADAAPAKKGGKKKLLLILAAVPILLAGAGGGAYFFVPSFAKTVNGLIGKHDDAAAKLPPGTTQTAANKPSFMDLPEMAVTLPNGGHAVQMRIHIVLELMPNSTVPTADVLSPRLYDALLTYLRTLRDNEVQGGLALDRMRADLYRRIDLMLGSGVVRDVLITNLILG